MCVGERLSVEHRQERGQCVIDHPDRPQASLIGQVFVLTSKHSTMRKPSSHARTTAPITISSGVLGGASVYAASKAAPPPNALLDIRRDVAHMGLSKSPSAKSGSGDGPALCQVHRTATPASGSRRAGEPPPDERPLAPTPLCARIAIINRHL